jgi:hypothetical protein
VLAALAAAAPLATSSDPDNGPDQPRQSSAATNSGPVIADAIAATDISRLRRTIRVLSDERTFTRSAVVAMGTRVRDKPNKRAPVVGRLAALTQDGTRELVPALREARLPNGDRWTLVRVPMRPNGVTGWVRREALHAYHVVHTYLRIDKGRQRATLYRSGKRIWSAPVGVGKSSTPTPAGHFYARDRLRTTRASIYGSAAFGTSAFSSLSNWQRGGIVGIHGTDEPGLIPGHVSHGCIRVRNQDVVRLARLMPLGTPIRIH